MGNHSAQQDYDVFLSYARDDDPDGKLMTALSQTMASEFKLRAGQALRVFLDTCTIDPTQRWKERIQHALERSDVMVALLSPSYFTSEWCCKEWDHFLSREIESRHRYGLSSDQGLIYPIKRVGWSRTIRLTDDQRERITEAENRNFADFQSIQPGEQEFEDAARKLTKSIIEVLSHLEAARSHIPGAPLSIMSRRVQFRLGTDREEFIRCLSRATRATIIGITNSTLAGYLKDALAKKQSEEGTKAFWRSLDIVFLSEAMLGSINDELTTGAFPDPHEATAKRIRLSGRAKRAVAYFLIRQNHPEHWNLYEYNYMLPFVGAFFEMENGERVVQIATFRPGYRTSDQLFFEVSDSAGKRLENYYEATFKEVIQQSRKQDEIILLGSPRSVNKRGFKVKHARFRRSVLMPAPNVNDWIAAVVIMLWNKEDGRVWPLLQIRTSDNATRELDMLSNLSGYINQQDCQESDQGARAEFLMPEYAYKNAVNREIKEELGVVDESLWSDPELIDEIRFFYPDKENFYFYLCRVEMLCPLDSIHPVARLERWPFQDILQVREAQVISSALRLLELMESRDRRLEYAAQVVADNLILHDHKELANRLTKLVGTQGEREGLRHDLTEMQSACLKYYNFGTERRSIIGLAALQYRVFFAALLPAYANIGTPDAGKYLERLEADTLSQESLLRLNEHYGSVANIGQVGFLGFDI